MGELLCIADNIQTMTSICEVCKRDNAVFSFYKPKYKKTDIELCDTEYVPICRNCYCELKNS